MWRAFSALPPNRATSTNQPGKKRTERFRETVTTSTISKPQPSGQPDDGFRPGLEGVVAFHTEIAEPDRDGGALRYRGVDIEDLAGKVTFGDVWASSWTAGSVTASRPPSRSP